MKKAYLAIFYVLILSPMLQARSNRPLANANKAGLHAKSIEQVLRLQDDEVDLATAALIVSENWSDMVYGRRYLARLDDMALEIRERLREKRIRANARAISVINEYLFDELGFKALTEATDPNSLFLHTVLEKKLGYCLSLSMLYLSIAERLDLPVYGVVVPGHFFVRYDDGRMRFNIETTSSGGTAPDTHYIEKFNVPKRNGDSIYMKNLNKIQTLGCFFNNLGNSYSEINDVDSAFLAIKRAVEINPTLSESRSNLGNIYLNKGRINEAIREFEAAIRINPNDAKAYNNLGSAYTRKEWFSYAASKYKESLRVDPNFVDAYKNLAFVYSKQESFGQAIENLRQALILKPDDPDCYCKLGDVYGLMNNYQRAISEYNKALRLKPDMIDVYYGLATCYNKLGRTNDEIQVYQRILSFNPGIFAALVNLGNAYFGQQMYTAAIEQYKKAVQIEPREAMIHYNIGAAYSNNNDYERAVAAYLKAVEVDPKIGDAHYGLAFGFYQLENYNLAWKHIRIAKELGVEVTDDQLEAIKSRLQ